MKIDQILSQYRRDFRAIYVCEHCGEKKEASGYDDANFHQNVITKMVCTKCGKIAPDNYRPLAPKYAEGTVV